MGATVYRRDAARRAVVLCAFLNPLCSLRAPEEWAPAAAAPRHCGAHGAPCEPRLASAGGLLRLRGAGNCLPVPHRVLPSAPSADGSLGLGYPGPLLNLIDGKERGAKEEPVDGTHVAEVRSTPPTAAGHYFRAQDCPSQYGLADFMQAAETARNSNNSTSKAHSAPRRTACAEDGDLTVRGIESGPASNPDLAAFPLQPTHKRVVIDFLCEPKQRKRASRDAASGKCEMKAADGNQTKACLQTGGGNQTDKGVETADGCCQALRAEARVERQNCPAGGKCELKTADDNLTEAWATPGTRPTNERAPAGEGARAKDAHSLTHTLSHARAHARLPRDGAPTGASLPSSSSGCIGEGTGHGGRDACGDDGAMDEGRDGGSDAGAKHGGRDAGGEARGDQEGASVVWRADVDGGPSDLGHNKDFVKRKRDRAQRATTEQVRAGPGSDFVFVSPPTAALAFRHHSERGAGLPMCFA